MTKQNKLKTPEEVKANDMTETAAEIPPVADSEATLLPNGEIILNRDLEPTNATETKFGKIDSFYSLRVELPFEGYCELEKIVRKYRRAGAARVLQSSYSDLDAMSLEV